MKIPRYLSPESAYWAFFERFNAKDPTGWAGVMAYPHVRVSAGDPGGPNRRFFNPRTAARLYPSADDYAAAARSMGWERFEVTGWVRTRGREPVRVHESDRLVVLAGGWTRVRADDSPIVSNRVLYTLVQIEGSWGIQARFGVDSHLPDADQASAAAAGLDCANRMRESVQTGDREGWLGCFGFPLTLVRGPGSVEVFDGPDQLRNQYSDWVAVASGGGPAEVIATGGTGVLVRQPTGAGPTDRSIGALIAGRNGQWRAIAVTGRF